MTGLFYAHSGLRYLVLFAGVGAILYYAYAWRAARPVVRQDRVLMAVFTGLLDLQVVLGFALVLGGIFYPALMGHLLMMIGAVVIAHGAAILGRRGDDARQSHGIRFLGVVASMLLIVGGIYAIGRGLLQTTLPTM
jgi:hypothetical protein